MNALHLLRGDLCVDLRRDDRGMAEHPLNDPDVGAAFEHVRCRAVPECMRVNSDQRAWEKESYSAGGRCRFPDSWVRGVPKGERRDCREIADAAVLPGATR